MSNLDSSIVNGRSRQFNPQDVIDQLRSQESKAKFKYAKDISPPKSSDVSEKSSEPEERKAGDRFYIRVESEGQKSIQAKILSDL